MKTFPAVFSSPPRPRIPCSGAAPALAVVVAAIAVVAAAGAERTSLLLTLDSSAIGPAVMVTGELRMAGAQVSATPWLGTGADTATGGVFRISTEHDVETAKTVKGLVRRCTLPKGVRVDVAGPAQGVLKGTTSLGDFDLDLDALREGREENLLGGKLTARRFAATERLTGDMGEEEYASVAVLPDGRAAVAYVAWDGTADVVRVRSGDEIRTVTARPGVCMEPRCAVDGDGALRVVWAASDDDRQWDLWGATGEARPVRLTKGTRNDFRPRLARDARGRVWVAWQSVADDLHYEIRLARLGARGLEDEVNVSRHAADDWDPALCATADGRIIVAWDSYRNGSFDVYFREYTASDAGANPLGDPRPLAASPKRESHASVCADAEGRVWFAWDVSNEDWGKHPVRGASLHSSRSVDVACLAQGKLQRPAGDFTKSLPGPMRAFAEYPQVAVDGAGRLWVVARVQNQVLAFPRPKGTTQQYGMWHLFASQYDGRDWRPPMLLGGSEGRQDVRADIATGASGDLLVAYGADGRVRDFAYVPVDYDVWLASLAGLGGTAGAPELAVAADLGVIAAVRPDPELDPLPREWTIGGVRHRLVIGDTHRHTDISRCANGRDGSLQDAYRYALDACGLDWLAISDHDQDILKHRADRIARPRQDYDWWRSQKACDLYSIPGRFVALYGYEHGGSYAARGGHKNVVTAKRGEPVVEADAPHELFAALADSGALAIPHQLADGASRMDWEKWNADFERVGEIFQTRGSYEYEGCPRAASIFQAGNSVWDALAKGVRIGIIASSDHGQTHQARAGVYVEEGDGPKGFSREGILAALRARRAFGATVAVSIRADVSGGPMGSEIRVEGAPRVEAVVDAPSPVTRLDVIREGRFVYSMEPKASRARLQFEDLDLKPGQSTYYYVRALIGESDVAWSSPIWVTRAE
jgi:hypothetical protein